MKKILILAECAVCAMTNGKIMMPALSREIRRREYIWSVHVKRMQSELDHERACGNVLTGRANA